MPRIWLGDTVEIIGRPKEENRVGEVVHIWGDRLRVKCDNFPFSITTNINRARRVSRIVK